MANPIRRRRRTLAELDRVYRKHRRAIVDAYRRLGSYAAVAEEVGLSRQRVHQIVRYERQRQEAR